MNSNQMYRRLACMLCAAVLLLTMPYAAALAEPQAPGATFAVNTTADTQDANPGNGICADSGGSCSLRAAVREANALAGADTITLPAGTYGLTQTGGGEDAGSTGDLDISSTLTIQGAGSASTIVDANDLDRVFHILSTGVVTITQVTIMDGTPPNVGSDVNARSGGGDSQRWASDPDLRSNDRQPGSQRRGGSLPRQPGRHGRRHLQQFQQCT